jgi:VWFA-related protein
VASSNSAPRPGRLLLLGSILAAAAMAQEPLPFTFDEEVRVQWVMVPVVVSSSSGYVEDLGVRDFRLFIDGQQVPIETFERDGRAAASLLLLQDLSGSMTLSDRLDLSRQTLNVLTAGLSSRDEVALVTFAHSRVRVDVPFTRDVEKLRREAAEWTPLGVTGLYDAMTWLPDVALGGQRLRRAAVVVTDGLDNASALEPERVTSLLRRYELPVYVLDLPGEEDGSQGPLVAMADQTGGLYFAIAAPDDVLEACRAINADLRHQYVLAFPTASGARSAAHQVQVEVRRSRRRQARHRSEYFGPPPSALAADGEGNVVPSSAKRR